ncbi:phosphoribosyltransferase family protein [Variovorax ureilyticus]|uniref:phosphoribosyltransferase family protein n=1 Tax=Variovorax ureilyticus TaxID=1836198 RepID=UPI003D664313
MLRRWAQRAFPSIAAGLPSQCAVCRAWPAQPICDACVARFAPPTPRCMTCALPVPPGVSRCGACTSDPPPLDACHAACAYAWPWPERIAEFKFRGNAGLASPLATLLRSAPWIEAAIEQADIVLPMPLTAIRMRERGFNQAYELAKRLAPNTANPGILLRTRDAPAQSGLTRAERLTNLRGMFALEPLRAAAVRNRRVVLVDDVMTTGASVFTAAEVLRRGGASHITAIVLARTDLPA